MWSVRFDQNPYVSPFKIALFGAGRIGHVHARNIVDHPSTALTYVVDPVEDRAVELAAGARAECVGEEIALGDAAIDAIVVASLTSTHAALIENGLEAGKAVFCEKPLDLDIGRVRDVLATIDRAPITEVSLKQAQAEERKKIGWLHQWKTTLIDDINRGRFKAPIAVGAANYTGASKATETRITFAVPPYGVVETDWVKVPADALLRISATLIDPKASDAAERQWLAAVFASVTEQTAAARELSETAIKAKPEYAKERGLLSLPKP